MLSRPSNPKAPQGATGSKTAGSKSLPGVTTKQGGRVTPSGRHYPGVPPIKATGVLPQFHVPNAMSTPLPLAGPPPSKRDIAQAVAAVAVAGIPIAASGPKARTLQTAVEKAVAKALPKSMPVAQIAEVIRNVKAKPSAQPVFVPVGLLAAAVAQTRGELDSSSLQQAVLGGFPSVTTFVPKNQFDPFVVSAEAGEGGLLRELVESERAVGAVAVAKQVEQVRCLDVWCLSLTLRSLVTCGRPVSPSRSASR